jgi:hypothetical protein
LRREHLAEIVGGELPVDQLVEHGAHIVRPTSNSFKASTYPLWCLP